MQENLYIVPAYGRYYDNEADMLRHWAAGRDFRIANGGPYCSIRDVEELRKICVNVYLVQVARAAVTVKL